LTQKPFQRKSAIAPRAILLENDPLTSTSQRLLFCRCHRRSYTYVLKYVLTQRTTAFDPRLTAMRATVRADGTPYQPNGDIALATANAPRSLAVVVATLIVRQKRYQAGARPRTTDAPSVTAQAVLIPLPKVNFHYFSFIEPRPPSRLTSLLTFAASRNTAE